MRLKALVAVAVLAVFAAGCNDSGSTTSLTSDCDLVGSFANDRLRFDLAEGYHAQLVSELASLEQVEREDARPRTILNLALMSRTFTDLANAFNNLTLEIQRSPQRSEDHIGALEVVARRMAEVAESYSSQIRRQLVEGSSIPGRLEAPPIGSMRVDESGVVYDYYWAECF